MFGAKCRIRTQIPFNEGSWTLPIIVDFHKTAQNITLCPRPVHFYYLCVTRCYICAPSWAFTFLIIYVLRSIDSQWRYENKPWYDPSSCYTIWQPSSQINAALYCLNLLPYKWYAETKVGYIKVQPCHPHVSQMWDASAVIGVDWN